MKDNRPQENRSSDDIARLLKLAGRRESVPKERFQRAREAANSAWQLELRRRRLRKMLWAAAGVATAASLILAVAVGWNPFGGATLDAPTIRVEGLQGTAWIEAADGARQPVTAELRVTRGSRLITHEDGRMALRLASGHSVRLDRSTVLLLADETDETTELIRGAVYVDSSGAGARLEVETPYGRVEEIGTQYELRLAPASLTVRLREGAVVLHHEDGDYPVQAKTELVIDADGATRTRSITTYGEEWGWLQGITPMLELEGKTARVFLEWAAREAGLRLAFSDEEVARAAQETVVAGQIAGMTVDQALEAVLPSCRMKHRISEGILVVDFDR